MSCYIISLQSEFAIYHFNHITTELTGFYGAQRSKNPVQWFVKSFYNQFVIYKKWSFGQFADISISTKYLWP